jgi:hypothetical protein
MFKAPLRASVTIAAMVVVLILGLVLGLVLGNTVFSNHGTHAANSSTPTSKPAPFASVTIPQDQELFDPFVVPVQLNITGIVGMRPIIFGCQILRPACTGETQVDTPDMLPLRVRWPGSYHRL